MNEDALQALANAKMEDKESMVNLTRTKLALFQSIKQAQEAMLVLYKHLQTLQAQINSKKNQLRNLKLTRKNINKSKR